MQSKIALALLSGLVCFSLHADKANKTSKTDKSANDAQIASSNQAQPNNSTPSRGCNFSEPRFERGDDPLSAACPSAYNMPAQVHLDRSHQVLISASYIYWNAQQDGMDLATEASFTGGLVTQTGVRGKTIIQDFEYKSGFKVGYAHSFENADNWTLRADYTRLHQTTNTRKSAPSSSTGIGVLSVTDWYFEQSSAGQTPAAENLKSRWFLALDWLDMTVSRAFYQGKKFTVTPFGGLRFAWLTQDLRIELENIRNFMPPFSSTRSENKESSWGIGPRMGLEGNLLLGMGFRFQGGLGASLLFTKYDRISHKEGPISSGSSIKYDMNDYTAVRPMMEMNLGLGWGMYLSRNRYHIDFSTTYEFNYLWSQNMLRTLNDIQNFGVGGANHDLSLHGLTLSGTFHF